MRNKPSKKKTLFGFFWNLFEHENIELIILGLASLFISIFAHSIYTNHSQIQAQFDQLAINSRNLSYADEELYTDCHNRFDSNEILTDINKLRNRLETLVNQYAEMGNLISLETYCSVRGFALWNDQLGNAGESVCKMQLLPETELEAWRDRILNQIYKNKEIRRGPISSIKEYISDIQKNVYTPNQCTPNMLQTILFQ